MSYLMKVICDGLIKLKIHLYRLGSPLSYARVYLKIHSTTK